MALSMAKKKPGFFINGTDCEGNEVKNLLISNERAATYLNLADIEERVKKDAEFKARRAALPDPERDLLLEIYGSSQVTMDPVLHPVLIEAQEARNGLSLDFEVDADTNALRLIAEGHSHRLLLMGDQLIDMGEDEVVSAPTQEDITEVSVQVPNGGTPGTEFIG